MSATAKKIEPGLLTLNVPEGEAQVPCDRIIARIGALPPRKFVEGCGIVFPSPAPTAFPQVSESYESNVPGLYIIGALAGYPLIKQCMNQGYEVVEFILGNQIAPADEPLIQAKLDPLPTKLNVGQLIDLIRERVPLFAALTTLQIRDFLLSSNVHQKRPGEVVFERGDFTNSFFTILHGEVDIQVNPANPAEVVTLGAGQFFGEMGLIAGRRRVATVAARSDCLLLEVARNTMIRLQRSVPDIKRGIDEVAIVRQIKTYLAPKVDDSLLDDVVRSAALVSFKPNEVLIEEGAADDPVFLIRTGAVTVSKKIGGKDIVLSYLPAGHYVGEMAMLTKAPRSATVKASVATEAIKIDSAAFRALLDREPSVHDQVRAKLEQRLVDNAKTSLRPENGGLIQFLMEQGIGEATDVLLIDESLCVRCDNCEKACAETHHGVSRLNREAGPTYASVHVPTSCRHCEHPHCMKDCPADAIKRDRTGEVYITDDCIGCGNCERNCPYGVIQMAAVPAAKPGLLSWLLFGRGNGPGEDRTSDGMAKRTGSKHAVKCDMCKDFDAGPACVRACPTGAAIRVNPEAFVAFVRDRAI
jgi:CRP-like cAMP-binding protein/Fe-S-cluster-containing hydrogenase component 2